MRRPAGFGRRAREHASRMARKYRRPVSPAKGAPPPKPVFKLEPGQPMANLFRSLANQKLDAFRNRPPAHQGAVGAVNQVLGGVLGALNAPIEAMDAAFAVATRGIAAAFPPLPAATLGTNHLGIPHVHPHPPTFFPPAIFIPLPGFGPVLFGCVSVLINSKPAARAGDVGVALTCFTMTPPFEVLTGSSKVFIGGARAARVGDLTLHCLPTVPVGKAAKLAGMALKLAKLKKAAQTSQLVAGNIAGLLGAGTSTLDSAHEDSQAAAAKDEKAKAQHAAAARAHALAATMGGAQMASDLAALALSMLIGKDPGVPPDMGMLIGPGSPNVLIGGFPMPNLMSLFRGIMKLARGLRKRRRRGAHDEAALPSRVGGCGCPAGRKR